MISKYIYLLGVIFLSSCINHEKLILDKDFSNCDYFMVITEIDTILYGKIEFQSSVKEGSVKIYLVNGGVATGQYLLDKKNGPWKFYDQSMIIYKIEHYTEGYLSRVEFFERGKKTGEVITDPAF